MLTHTDRPTDDRLDASPFQLSSLFFPYCVCFFLLLFSLLVLVLCVLISSMLFFFCYFTFSFSFSTSRIENLYEIYNIFECARVRFGWYARVVVLYKLALCEADLGILNTLNANTKNLDS